MIAIKIQDLSGPKVIKLEDLKSGKRTTPNS